MWTNLKPFIKSTIFTPITTSQQRGKTESNSTAASVLTPDEMHMDYWNNN